MDASNIINLEAIIGCSTAANTVHALDSQRLVYLSGNIAVIFDRKTRANTLLRGHRNPVKACCLNGVNGYILSGCAGLHSSLIYWDASGIPVVSYDEPHAQGILAMDVSRDGKFLVTLSVPFSEAGEPPHHHQHHQQQQYQEVRLWQMPQLIDNIEGNWSPFLPVASSLVPVADLQHAVAFNHSPHHSSVANLALQQQKLSTGTQSLLSATARLDDGAAALQILYEFATTGNMSVLFWSMRAVRFDTAANSASTALISATNILSSSIRSLKPGACRVEEWGLACSVARVPNAPAVKLINLPVGAALSSPLLSSAGLSSPLLSSQALPSPLPGKLEGSTGLPGDAELENSEVATAGVPQSTHMRREAAGGSGDTKTGAGQPQKICNVTTFLPLGTLSGSTNISALTGTSDGTLILWCSTLDGVDLWEGTPLASMFVTTRLTSKTAIQVVDTVEELSKRLVGRSAAKTIKLSRPDALADALQTSGTQNLSQINTLALSPCSQYAIVGSEDGAVRVYDMQMRLVAWWDEIAAGAISSLSFVPPMKVGDPDYQARDFPPPKASTTGLPDFLLATRSSLLLHLSTSSFDSPDPEQRKGEILLEGPDAAVVGIASYPHPYANLLAIAVASGCIQLWDSSTQQLLAVRELIRPHGFAAGSAAAAAAALQAPQVFHPTAISIDRYARFLAIGTTEGHVCILDPLNLADVQPAIAPVQSSGSSSITQGTANLTTMPGAVLGTNQGSQVNGPTSMFAKSKGSPVTRLAFAEDGLHLAAADADRHVMVFRFTRARDRQVSARATSRLGLGATGALLGRRHYSGPAKSSTTPRRPRPWELVDGDETGLEEVVQDTWIYLGRARSHAEQISGLEFSPLGPGEVSPHVLDHAATAGAFKGGYEHESFWDVEDIPVTSLISRHRSHGLSMLASIGLDKKLVLYDIGASSVATGLIIAGHGQRFALTQFASPTSLLWYPPKAPMPDTELDAEHAQSCVVVADSTFKVKMWSVGDRTPPGAKGGTPQVHCRKTVLGPTFGGALTHMNPIHTPDSTTPFVAFATDDRVVGVMALPLTGNPFCAVGTVAHPGPVTGLTVSSSGELLYTCGLESTASGHAPAGNGSVCIWRFNADALNAQLSSGGSGLAPFLAVLEGGADGAMYQSICDMFSYAQIRSQGESSTERRRAGITLPLSELAAVMRALGYYPTAAEVTAMTTETRGMNAVRLGVGGSAAFGITSTEEVDLPTLVQLYVNHRPVVAVGADDLNRALVRISEYVARTEGIRLRDRASGKAGDKSDLFRTIRWGSLAKLLGARAEKMSPSELQTCLTALLGPIGANSAQNGGTSSAATHFHDDDELDIQEDIVNTVLGFEVVE